MLVRLFRDNPHVIGADLRNEPRNIRIGNPGPGPPNRRGASARSESRLVDQIIIEGIKFPNDLSGVRDESS